MNTGHKLGNQLYRHLLVFILLEEPRTVKELLDELAQYGFNIGVKAIQRTVVQLQAAGFPIECKSIKGHGRCVWQWRETTNVVDNLIKAKARLGLTVQS